MGSLQVRWLSNPKGLLTLAAANGLAGVVKILCLACTTTEMKSIYGLYGKSGLQLIKQATKAIIATQFRDGTFSSCVGATGDRHVLLRLENPHLLSHANLTKSRSVPLCSDTLIPLHDLHLLSSVQSQCWCVYHLKFRAEQSTYAICRHVQWCNGGPGVIDMLYHVWMACDFETWLNDLEFITDVVRAAIRAGECVWRRCLVKKASCIPHDDSYTIFTSHGGFIQPCLTY